MDDDHHLVVAKMNMRITKNSKRKGTQKKWNVKDLKSEQKKQNYEEVKTQLEKGDRNENIRIVQCKKCNNLSIRKCVGKETSKKEKRMVNTCIIMIK